MPEIDTGDPRQLVFHQPIGVFARLLFGGAGALCLLAPYELLIKPGVALFQISMIPFWFISIGASAIAAVFLLAAILGLTRTVTFDARTRVLIVDGNGSFGISWKTRFPFAAVTGIVALEDRQTERPPRYIVQAEVLSARGPVEIDTFASEFAAREAEAKVRALLGSETPLLH